MKDYFQAAAQDMMPPRVNAIITNIQDPTEKPKRKSRAQLSPGRPLSFYEVVELIRTRFSKPRTHPTTTTVYWGRPMSIFFVATRPFSQVMAGAMSGEIAEVIRPNGYQCQCLDCKNPRVKNPRGPKRQKDGTILYSSFLKYRGPLGFEEMQKLRPLVVDEKGKFLYLGIQP